MSFGQVLVFADEKNDVIPEVLVEVTPQAITDIFGFANVDRRLAGFRIGTNYVLPA
jgi:hypothetical protein